MQFLLFLSIFIRLFFLVVSRPQSHDLSIIPPQIQNVLPPDAIEKINAIHNNKNIKFQKKQEQIDKIMVNLPTEILDRIPLPPGFDNLPLKVQTTIKNINRNKIKSWPEKQVELDKYIQSLPVEQRKFLIGAPHKLKNF